MDVLSHHTTAQHQAVQKKVLLADAVEGFLAHRRQAGCAVTIVSLYTRQLNDWMRWRQEHGQSAYLSAVKLAELRGYIAYLQQEHIPLARNGRAKRESQQRGLAPASVASVWRTLRAAWNQWIAEDLLGSEQCTFFLRERIPRPKVPQQVRPTYKPADLDTLLTFAQQARDQEDAARDRVIVLLLYESGMRVSELTKLSDANLDLASQQAVVTGKGNKQRYVFWGERAQHAITHYLALRSPSDDPDQPFLRSRGTGRQHTQSGRRLTADTVRLVLRRIEKRARKAGHTFTLPKGAPVHALRHTFAHEFLDNGGDGLHLQQLMGHESMETTRRYVKENATGLRRVYRRVMGG